MQHWSGNTLLLHWQDQDNEKIHKKPAQLAICPSYLPDGHSSQRQTIDTSTVHGIVGTPCQVPFLPLYQCMALTTAIGASFDEGLAVVQVTLNIPRAQNTIKSEQQRQQRVWNNTYQPSSKHHKPSPITSAQPKEQNDVGTYSPILKPPFAHICWHHTTINSPACQLLPSSTYTMVMLLK